MLPGLLVAYTYSVPLDQYHLRAELTLEMPLTLVPRTPLKNTWLGAAPREPRQTVALWLAQPEARAEPLRQGLSPVP